MNSLYHQAKFLLSAPDLNSTPEDTGREVAFAGRSNGNQMKKSLIAVSMSFTLLNMSGIAQAAGDIDAGQVKSGSCASCHGANGNSMMPLFPKLAAQNEGYLVKQMQAFKDGSRAFAIRPMTGNTGRYFIIQITITINIIPHRYQCFLLIL
jgi:hypothetical protein